MTTHAPAAGRDARTAVLDALHRLRTQFPLEQRLRTAPPAVRRAYAELLALWRNGKVRPPRPAMSPELGMLARLDAVVPGDAGIGCYPFSARDTGIEVRFAGHTAYAMCAIDALAVARLVGHVTHVTAHCDSCRKPLACRIEANGSLEHDQLNAARVLWRAHAPSAAHCSAGLCRAIVFLCGDCRIPVGDLSYTLPQATAIGNAFFAFQRQLE